MKLTLRKYLGVLGAFSVMFVPFASADVMGTVQTSAASGGGSVTITNDSITFSPGSVGICPQNAAAPFNDGTTFCDFSVSGGNMTYGAGSTLAVTTSYNGTFGDITLSPVSIQQPFAIFNNAAGTEVVQFDLTSILSASTTNGTNCASALAGQTCSTLAGSPFSLLAIGGGSGTGGEGTILSMSVVGTALDLTDGSNGFFSGKFSETIDNLAPVDVQNLLNGNGSLTTGSTASFTATLPEPTVFGSATWLLVAGLFFRRKLSARFRS